VIEARSVTVAGIGVLLVIGFQLRRIAQILNLLGPVVVFALSSVDQILCA
jgi:hypothetical protein